MASIAVIVKAGSEIEELPTNWVPEALSARGTVYGALSKAVGFSVPAEVQRISLREPPLSLALELEIDEGPEPRSITVSGVFGAGEMAFLGQLCGALSARLFDSESCEFII